MQGSRRPKFLLARPVLESLFTSLMDFRAWRSVLHYILAGILRESILSFSELENSFKLETFAAIAYKGMSEHRLTLSRLLPRKFACNYSLNTRIRHFILLPRTYTMSIHLNNTKVNVSTMEFTPV